jgi:hypothetical protein
VAPDVDPEPPPEDPLPPPDEEPLPVRDSADTAPAAPSVAPETAPPTAPETAPTAPEPEPEPLLVTLPVRSEATVVCEAIVEMTDVTCPIASTC